jgi:hypothetical protein
VADHFHNTRDLIRCHKAPSFALGDDLAWHLILLGLEYCRLMKTDSGCVDIHVGKDDIDIIHTAWESKMLRQGKCNVEQDIIMTAVALPKLAIEVMIIILRLGSVNVIEISAKQIGQNTDTGKWSQR